VHLLYVGLTHQHTPDITLDRLAGNQGTTIVHRYFLAFEARHAAAGALNSDHWRPDSNDLASVRKDGTLSIDRTQQHH
jgi:hypothetical protein